MGLKSFLRTEEQSTKFLELMMDEEKKEESGSPLPILNQTRTALEEIKTMLQEMIVVMGREAERGGNDEGRSGILKEIGGMLAQHFPEVFESRRTRIGASAIEFFPPTLYSLSGNTFTKHTIPGGGNLVSFELGAVVARLSLIVGGFPKNNYLIGIISSGIPDHAQEHALCYMDGGVGCWDLIRCRRATWLNKQHTNDQQACQVGEAGQRVVIEADGREGRRTLRMSQDGETQPAFFTNIPVPFRFAVCVYEPNESVTIKSVEIVQEAQMVGGTIPV
ncbi:hypothetical protein BLNAU_14902 [Blattamonas nauphoetae]|uniref:Uncharacterized protein n=1 Tax=Blattamonas nauphoetae TaxID=2049346 RepID=A0ABQ9XFV0_9EUKA|nr:hypothetical protein BLNAU_14902 [Blattamonas nauphoetae]